MKFLIKTWYKTIIRLAIGFGILFIVFYHIGINKIFSTMLTVHPVFILIVVVAIALEHIYNGYALKLLAKDYNIPLIKYIVTSLRSWSISIFTPGRLGDFSMIYFLNKTGISLGQSTAFFLLNRLINMSIQFSFASAGIIIFELKQFFPQFCMMTFSFLLVFCVFIVSDGIREYLNKLIPKKFQGKLLGFATTIKQLIIERPFLLFVVFLVQLIKILSTHGFTMLMFFSIGQHIKFWHICSVFSIARIVSLIPISVNGLGIKESALVYLLGYYCNIDAAIVITVVLLNQVVAYSIAAGICLKIPGK